MKKVVIFAHLLILKKMKIIQSSIFRVIISVVVGVLLIQFREATMTWIIRCIGILFFLSGMVSCIVYWVETKRSDDSPKLFDANGNELSRPRPFFPIVGIGSMFLGCFLSFMPTTFIVYAMYMLGGILVFGAINQFFNLAGARRYSSIPFIYWLFPCLTLLIAVYIMSKPLEAGSMPLFLTGWCFIFYGVIELLNTIQIFRMRKSYEKSLDDIEDAEIVE